MHTRAATAREAAKGVFPFLELPPEIRISIYEFALGGNTIYYTTELSSDFFDYAGHVHRSKALGGEVKAPEDTMDREDDSPRRHYRCAHYKRQHLSVISLCKQTHKEAALFPFITNTFVFDTPKHLDRFSKSLRAIQRKSVRAAVLHEAGGQRLWSPWNPDPKAAMLSSLLPGLQSLTLFWEVVPRDLLPSMKGSRSGADLEECAWSNIWHRRFEIAITSGRSGYLKLKQLEIVSLYHQTLSEVPAGGDRWTMCERLIGSRSFVLGCSLTCALSRRLRGRRRRRSEGEGLIRVSHPAIYIIPDGIYPVCG